MPHTQYHYYAPHVSLMCGFTSMFISTYVHVLLQSDYWALFSIEREGWEKTLSEFYPFQTV